MTFQERYLYNPQTDLLGKGGFARVYKAKDTLLDREVAIKIFNATDKEKYSVVEEIRKAIRLQHPSLLRYFDVAVLDNTNALGEVETLQIGVMELANYGDLKAFIKNHPQSPLINGLLIEVLDGLAYLHSKGIIHRDLKPQNILLVKDGDDINARISDFGISKSTDAGGDSSSAVLGTIEYMAPEQFSPAKYGIEGKISTNLDLWSFGIMVYELFSGKSLFGRRSASITSEQIMSAILSSSTMLPEDVELLPEPYKTIVKKCLVADARQRLKNAKELIPLLKKAVPDISDNETQAYNFSPKNTSDDETKAIEIKTILKKNIEQPILNNISNQHQVLQRKKIAIWKIVVPIAIVLLAGSVYFLGFPKKGESSEASFNYYATHKNDSNADTSLLLQKLKFAADNNYDTAMDVYALLLLKEKDTINALKYLEKVTGHSSSVKKQLARIWQKNDPVNKATDIENNFITCANSGDADCMFESGMILYNKGSEEDKVVAAKWFTSSANAGNSKAQAMLGTMYYNASGGLEKNDNEALRWYMKAAEQGSGVAEYSIGLFYEQGNAVAKNIKEAKKYFKMALNGDNEDAKTAAAAELKTLGEN